LLAIKTDACVAFACVVGALYELSRLLLDVRHWVELPTMPTMPTTFGKFFLHTRSGESFQNQVGIAGIVGRNAL
jgi:hypothetical protein